MAFLKHRVRTLIILYNVEKIIKVNIINICTEMFNFKERYDKQFRKFIKFLSFWACNGSVIMENCSS